MSERDEPEELAADVLVDLAADADILVDLAADADILVDLAADGVAVVTLNRPAQLNALTPAMHLRYVKALHDLDSDPACRAIVVTGAGRGWCSGADLGSLAGLASGERFVSEDPDLAGVDLGWAMTMDTPMIAAVNGPVAGMGFSHMLMADVRYAVAGATITSTFAQLGLLAEWGSAWLLPRLVGLANASDILLSGRSYTAEHLHELGLIQRVLPPEELLPAAMGWAREIAGHSSPRSTAGIKAQLRRSAVQAPEAAFAESISLMLESFGWPDLAEAVSARAQHRAPEFPSYPLQDL